MFNSLTAQDFSRKNSFLIHNIYKCKASVPSLVKVAILMIIKRQFSSVLWHRKICCDYSLELPWQGISNEPQYHMFLWRNVDDFKIIHKLSSNSHLIWCTEYLVQSYWSSAKLYTIINPVRIDLETTTDYFLWVCHLLKSATLLT